MYEIVFRVSIIILAISSSFPLMSLLGGDLGGFNFGINLYYTLLIFLSLFTPYYLFLKRNYLDANVKRILGFLALFVIFASVTSIVFPRIFEGVPVYTPRIGIDSQVKSQTPLRFTFSNIGQ